MKSSVLKIGVPFDFKPEIGFFIRADLVRCLESQGACLVPMLYDTQILDLVMKELDGVLIPGGVGDVDPEFYGEKTKYDCVCVNRARCEFEFELFKRYLPSGKPLLCICWGLQCLNVYLGGSLFQDLETDRKSSVVHDQDEPVHLATKWVNLVEGGKAQELFGGRRLFVNSTHHQGISEIAESVVVEGYAEDGLIECFRIPEHPFAWAVQWHPERLKGDPVIPVFLEACRRSRS